MSFKATYYSFDQNYFHKKLHILSIFHWILWGFFFIVDQYYFAFSDLFYFIILQFQYIIFNCQNCIPVRWNSSVGITASGSMYYVAEIYAEALLLESNGSCSGIARCIKASKNVSSLALSLKKVRKSKISVHHISYFWSPLMGQCHDSIVSKLATSTRLCKVPFWFPVLQSIFYIFII